MRESVFMDIPSPSRQQTEKLNSLKKYIRTLGSTAVAFSGGVDSTFLLKVAHEELGDKCVAVTAMSCSFPQRELEEAIKKREYLPGRSSLLPACHPDLSMEKPFQRKNCPW